MIVFDLSCSQAHRFEGWFGSADDFANQSKEGRIACPVCGSVEVVRQLSAPYVNTRGGPTDGESAQAVANAAQALQRKFIEYVLQNTEDVGGRFPEEARRIFYKEAPERAIRGTASPEEVAALKDEGVDVLPVPGVTNPTGKPH